MVSLYLNVCFASQTVTELDVITDNLLRLQVVAGICLFVSQSAIVARFQKRKNSVPQYVKLLLLILSNWTGSFFSIRYTSNKDKETPRNYKIGHVCVQQSLT